MPEHRFLQCRVCAASYELSPLFFGCPQCAQACRKAALEVRYNSVPQAFPSGDRPGIWKWSDLLPSPGTGITLGEGDTPLVAVGPGLYLKNETSNPTWSYKDRAAAVSITMARAFQLPATVCISTGNLGNAVAAYSTAAGLCCTIFCNPDAPDLQLALMQLYGARVFRGGNANALVHRYVARGDVFPASIICPLGGFANPYGIEGFKTIAFEIWQQLGHVPDRVFVPAGSGDGLYGIYKGFVELRQFGLTDRVPRMIACQAEGAACYVKAQASGAPAPVHIGHPNTVALSIAEEVGGYPALTAIRESGGDAIAVTDEQILTAMRALAKKGLAIEPSSASTYAVATAIADQIPDNETAVLIATGSLVKWPPQVTRSFTMPPVLPPDYTDLAALL